MKTIRYILVFFLASFGVQANANSPGERKPEVALAEILSEPATLGSVYAQGKLDGVDYRKLLRGAVRKDNKDLGAIFLYSGKNKLMGEGAESNIDVLHELLRLWGDHEFSKVLRSVPKQAQISVVGFLREGFAFRDSEFPETTSLVSTGDTGRRYRLTIQFTEPDYKMSWILSYREDFHLFLDNWPIATHSPFPAVPFIAGSLYPKNGATYISLGISSQAVDKSDRGETFSSVKHLKLPANHIVELPGAAGAFKSCRVTIAFLP